MSEHTDKPMGLQEKTETNVFILAIILMVVLSIGGLVEIAPLFYLDDTMEHNRHSELVWDRPGDQANTSLGELVATGRWSPGDGVRPYTATELAGRDIYLREGCYNCHSQMIRPFRDERERYGHYSLATESMYDHPFQWGSKRTGPDLARVGGKFSDEWHAQHMRAPRSLVPGSIMPNYPWLDNKTVNGDRLARHMNGLRMIGVPYTAADIAAASGEVDGMVEMDALIAYLQVLGTMVDLDDSIDYRP